MSRRADGEAAATEPGFLTAGIDFEHPNVARMYDYYLGGANNFAVDRELAEQVAAGMPSIRRWAQGNRAFLRRIVRHCAGQGVRQFLDLGSGIPATGHVHETARAIDPAARVAYVDFEPVAVAYGSELLADVDGVSITRADVRDPAAVLAAPGVTQVLDLAEPVAVLAIAVMHFVSDADDPADVLAGYVRRLAPGSYLAMSHVSTDYADAGIAAQIRKALAAYRESATPGHDRDRDRIRELVGPLPLVEPGLVDINHWRQDDPDAPQLGNYAALARVG